MNLRRARVLWNAEAERHVGGSAPVSVQGRVEVLDGLTLRGWAHVGTGDDGDIALWLDDIPLETVRRRTEREDVRQALQTDWLELGFLLELPAAMWQHIPQDGRGQLSVRVKGQPLVSQPDMVWDRARLQQMLAGLGDVPVPLREAWIAHAQAADLAHALPSEWAAAVHASMEAEVAPMLVHGLVEAREGLLLRGWVSLAGAAEERVTLQKGRAHVDAAVVRVSREDVRQAVSDAGPFAGFELELPVQIWADVPEGGEVDLQVAVNGQPLQTAVPLRLDRGILLAELESLHFQSFSLASQGKAAEQLHQYRLLAVIEHLAQAGWLSKLSSPLRRFVWEAAERFGVATLLPPADLQQEMQGLPAGPDIGQVTVWRALADFNTRLQAQVDPVQALQETLDALSLGDETCQRFLQALIPYFCSQHHYGLLRPWLDLPLLREQASTTQAWSVSLFLPECVAAGDFRWASDVVRRLGEVPGWLNTECVGQASRDLLRYSERHLLLEDDGGLPLVRALVGLLDRVASDAWGRSHDAHLVDAQVSLLLMLPSLPDELRRDLLDKADRHYGLVPAFWGCLDSRWPSGVPLPGRLIAARRGMNQLQQRLKPATLDRFPSREDLDMALAQLRPGQSRWHADAWRTTREIVLAQCMLSSEGESSRLERQFGELSGLATSDVLRLAAHPLTDERADLPSDVLSATVRGASGVALGSFTEQIWSTWQRLRDLSQSAERWSLAALPTLADCRRFNEWSCHFLGTYFATVRLALMAEHAPTGDGAVPFGELAELRGLWMRAWQQRAQGQPLVAPLWNAMTLVGRLQQRWPAQRGWSGLLAEWLNCLPEEAQAAARLPEPEQLRLRSPGWMQDTLVVVYSCRANLATRVQAIRDSWGQALTAAGIPWVVLVGDGDGLAPTGVAGDVLALPVADTYEQLPQKTLALLDWVRRHSDFAYLYKIDDDCHLDVQSFQARSLHRCHHYMGRPLQRTVGATDRRWHQNRSATPRAASALDKSPEPSIYADGGSGYFVSRAALELLGRRVHSPDGARLLLSSFMEDKLVGDLLSACGFYLSAEGYETLVRRRFGAGSAPVNAYQNTFYPGRSSSVWVTHLDESAAMATVEAGLDRTALRPARLWPTVGEPVLGGVAGTNQLELLSSPEGVAALVNAPVIVVAVARNEMILMPHFLSHYRRMGVRHFVLVDNLSDDGTREYLLAQPDVVLYSADTEYRYSQYGVAWQQAVLGAHALGRWVVLADIDELLVYRDCEHRPILDWLSELDAQGHDAAMTLMVDMYPQGDLSAADFTAAPGTPFELAPCFDSQPLVSWKLGAGNYSNGPTYLSALRHRLIPDSAPNLYTSQKVAVFRYAPWVRLSQGLHYASNLRVSHQPAVFAHFKYHAGFQRKVQEEIARKQHFNGAEEYRKYLALLAESRGSLWSPDLSTHYQGSQSLLDAATRCHRSQG